MAVVEVDLISRDYQVRRSGQWRRQTVSAVDEVSFVIERGELFGLLGPNGAGKTTIVKMLTTLLLPSAGAARVLGLDVVTEHTLVRRQVGYVFGGERGLYDRLTAYDNLRYFAELYGVPPREQRTRIGELLEMVELTGRQRDRVEGFSRGMRQRLHIARGLLHDPPVVFLDEPSIGLDPVGARTLRMLVRNLVAGGKTVLLTTHYMYEADELCDRIGIIDGGRMVAEGTPAELKTRVAEGRLVEVVVYGAHEETIGKVRRIPGVTSVTVEERDQAQVVLVRLDQATDPSTVVRCLDGAPVRGVTTRSPTLEDAYVELVGRS